MFFRFESFDGLPLRHAMSVRRPGLPSEGDIAFAPGTDPEHIASNRKTFLESAGFNPAALTLGRQVHGNTVSIVHAGDRGRGQPPEFDALPDSDGLVTGSSDVVLGTIVADCVPILIYDPNRHALGILHAGWRGTVGMIAFNGVERMAEAFGSEPEDLRAGIGPSIGPCCYEVGPEVIDAWEKTGVDSWQDARVEKSPRPHFDLWTANRLLLEKAGISTGQIEVAEKCTRCSGDDFFSHRAAMAAERARGRMIMVAQLAG